MPSPSAPIYVVDDDPSVRRGLRRMLKSAGFEVETFESGDEFLEQWEAVQKSCLILDVKMPGIDGLKLQDRLNSYGSQIPIIFITAHDDPEARIQALDHGATAFLDKPVEDEVLLDAIETAMRNAQNVMRKGKPRSCRPLTTDPQREHRP